MHIIMDGLQLRELHQWLETQRKRGVTSFQLYFNFPYFRIEARMPDLILTDVAIQGFNQGIVDSSGQLYTKLVNSSISNNKLDGVHASDTSDNVNINSATRNNRNMGRIELENSNVDDNGRDGIRAPYGYNVKATDSSISRNKGHGIHITKSAADFANIKDPDKLLEEIGLPGYDAKKLANLLQELAKQPNEEEQIKHIEQSWLMKTLSKLHNASSVVANIITIASSDYVAPIIDTLSSGV